MDYTVGPYYVTFTAGYTSATFDVNITKDNVFEESEYFTLTIVSSKLLDRKKVYVTRDNRSQTKVIIIDDSNG